LYEDEAELAALQTLLDASFTASSEHLLDIMPPPRRLTARRLSAELDGVCVLTIATVTATGEPRASAVDGHFLRGHWYFTTDGRSPKARQLTARPAVSAAYTPRDGFGVFCHGTAIRVEPGTSEYAELDRHWIQVYGGSFEAMADDIAVFRIDPRWLVGFAMTPAEMIEIAAEEAARAARRTQL
jgi:hypothetical protein